MIDVVFAQGRMRPRDNTPVKRAVIREWDTWVAKNANIADSNAGGTLFFSYLQQSAQTFFSMFGDHPTTSGRPCTDGYYGRGEYAAIRRADSVGKTKGGAVAFSRTGDPAIGEFTDAVVLGKFGDVPDDLSEI